MAEKTIKLASFWYLGEDGIERTALRGETVELGEADVARGERLGTFASDADLKPGTVFGDWYTAQAANQKAATDAGIPALVEPVNPDAPEKPAASASRATWAAYAASKGAPEAETAEQGGLTRDQLREKYGA